MKKSPFIISAIASLIICGIIAFNFWMYEAPTPCFGKKTNWTQAEIEEHFMRSIYRKSAGYPTYESFREHPNTVLTFKKGRPSGKTEMRKGHYTLFACYKVLEGKRAGIIEERGKSYSKCLRLRGKHGWRFDPQPENYNTKLYMDRVEKKKALE